MNEYIIFIGTHRSGSSRDGIEAGKKLGYSTILFTNNRRIIREKDLFPEVDEMVEVDLKQEEALRKEITSLQQAGKKIACIISFFDAHVSLSARLSNEFCGTDITLQPIADCMDKTELRMKLTGKEYSPDFIKMEPPFSTDKARTIPYPFILKSPVSNGSKDVLLIHDEEELAWGIKKLNRKKPSTILVEEYLDGPQYLIEAVVKEGKPVIAVVVKQEINYQKRFIVTGYSVSPENHQPELVKKVEEIINDLGFINGSCHLEMRLVKDQWKLIEINPRISGGAMNKMIEEAYGLSIVEETLRVYLSKPNTIKPKWKKHIYTCYMTVNKVGKLLKVSGQNKAEEHEGIIEVYIKSKKGKILRPPTSMGHRYGYVMAYGESVQESEERAKNAAKEIRFYLEST
ncbi:ATP-grasp domain-containing protein [Bacillus sp. Marseille-Q1617]|uniref:ATP-grasp domain-containing protein n=1 Tax=Bacillus sp. Marseille-Q1617 TaxID=2736887 RepID=UPI00158CBB12|nr:ATP-grasp domain-containing protein [Bacillus sp. Marseille-Q1617]